MGPILDKGGKAVLVQHEGGIPVLIHHEGGIPVLIQYEGGIPVLIQYQGGIPVLIQHEEWQQFRLTQSKRGRDTSSNSKTSSSISKRELNL